MERKPSDESLRQIEHVSTATKKSVLRFTYRETPTLSSMSSHRSESQRSQGSRRQQCQSGGRDTKSTALVRPLRYKICTHVKVRFERFMIHACSFQGGKLSSCPFKTMNYDTFKKKGKVEDKWHRWLGESHSKSFLFVEVVSCCFGQPPATIMPASRISDTPGSQFTTNNSMLEIQCARLLYHYCEDLAIQLGMVVQCN